MFNPIFCLRQANGNDLFLSLLRRAALSFGNRLESFDGTPKKGSSKRETTEKGGKVLITNFSRLYFRTRDGLFLQSMEAVAGDGERRAIVEGGIFMEKIFA